ncbi:MAG: prolyl oligopeptidase family serine peptidase [Bacteroidota bacterium]|nr:prolyl oligopeptidase family serine peptidase [Bacteroidota bacterium]
MKKIALLPLIGLLSLTAIAQTPNLTGMWEGKLNVGVTLRLVFHFQKSEDGGFKGTMDSPDQGAKGIPFSAVTVNQDSVTAEIKSIGGAFRGKFEDDSTLSGLWIQGGRSFPLVLKPVAKVEALVRPQTPKPPFNYHSEEVHYDNADKSIHFGGTFTYPNQGGPFPTALLITGSGQQDRDETIFEHKPFAVIADYLTKRGYAILRVDDRGVGETSAGDLKNATSADFAKDVEAGLTYLRTRKEVDPTRLGLIGHSEGGLIEDIVASTDRKIYFLIMLAGPGEKGVDLLADQARSILLSTGVPPTAADAYKPLYISVLHAGLGAADTTAAIQEAMASYLQWKKVTPDSIQTVLQLNQEENGRKMVSLIIKEISIPWFKFFLNTDPALYIRKLHCRVLALNGSKDVQVVPGPNLAAIRTALTKSKSPEYETRELPGLNHLFQKCRTCTVQEYGALEETFDPSALKAMGDWLDKNVKKSH